MCDNVMAKREKEVLDREFGEARGPIVFNVIETLRVGINYNLRNGFMIKVLDFRPSLMEWQKKNQITHYISLLCLNS